MLITVSGPAGSGKSTFAGDLADRLGYEHVSGGDIFREIAAERDMTPLELNRQAEDDDRIDRDLDRRLRTTAREETVARSKSEASRYEAYYGIDITDLTIYDLVINTARWSPDGVLLLVEEAVATYDPAADEGQTPVTGVTHEFE